MPDDLVLTEAEEAAFQRALVRLRKRRQLQLAGYTAALAVIVLGTLAGLVLVGRAPRGRFIGWVFLVPMAFSGFLMWVFGRWARNT